MKRLLLLTTFALVSISGCSNNSENVVLPPPEKTNADYVRMGEEAAAARLEADRQDANEKD